jgi:hypothetical protein
MGWLAEGNLALANRCGRAPQSIQPQLYSETRPNRRLSNANTELLLFSASLTDNTINKPESDLTRCAQLQ